MECFEVALKCKKAHCVHRKNAMTPCCPLAFLPVFGLVVPSLLTDAFYCVENAILEVLSLCCYACLVTAAAGCARTVHLSTSMKKKLLGII